MQASDVTLCPSCGQMNSLPRGGDLGEARCGKCDARLFPKAAASPAPRRAPASAARSGFGLRHVVAIAMLGVVSVLGLLVMDEDRERLVEYLGLGGEQTVEPVLEPLPPAVAIRPGLVWNLTGRRAEAPLEIVTSPGANYFVKLVDRHTGRDALAAYVVGGRPLTLDVPLGSYHLRYAAGETWRGEPHYFGPGNLTRFSEASTRLDFEVQGHYVSGYTVELVLQAGGNMPTRNIDRGAF